MVPSTSSTHSSGIRYCSASSYLQNHATGFSNRKKKNVARNPLPGFSAYLSGLHRFLLFIFFLGGEGAGLVTTPLSLTVIPVAAWSQRAVLCSDVSLSVTLAACLLAGGALRRGVRGQWQRRTTTTQKTQTSGRSRGKWRWVRRRTWSWRKRGQWQEARPDLPCYGGDTWLFTFENMAEEPSLTMPTFVVVMLTILVWELVLRPLVMDPTYAAASPPCLCIKKKLNNRIRLGIVNIDKLWPHRETLWKHRQLVRRRFLARHSLIGVHVYVALGEEAGDGGRPARYGEFFYFNIFFFTSPHL